MAIEFLKIRPMRITMRIDGVENRTDLMKLISDDNEPKKATNINSNLPAK